MIVFACCISSASMMKIRNDENSIVYRCCLKFNAPCFGQGRACHVTLNPNTSSMISNTIACHLRNETSHLHDRCQSDDSATAPRTSHRRDKQCTSSAGISCSVHVRSKNTIDNTALRQVNYACEEDAQLFRTMVCNAYGSAAQAQTPLASTHSRDCRAM